MKLSHALTALLLLFCSFAHSQPQTYYGTSWHNSNVGFWYGYSKLHKLTVDNGTCTDETIGIYLGSFNDSILVRELCHCPDNFLYASALDDSTFLYKINPANAQIVGIIPLSDNIGVMTGMVCNAANKIHGLKGWYPSRFVEVDPSNGQVTTLGTANEPYSGYLLQHDSVWYSMNFDGIRRIDLGTDPFEAELIIPSNVQQGGFSVFPGPCNTFLKTVWETPSMEVYLTNIDNHTNTFQCFTDEYFHGLARVGGDYYDPSPSCPVPIDLDRNNNSGAMGGDYNSMPFNCKVNGVPIADNDAFIPAYPIIDTMWVSISEGILDPGKEGLYMGLPPTGIAVSGTTSPNLVITNASGNARVADFVQTLKSIVYKDVALSPIGGIRKVKVSFVTRQGFPTDTAFCFVNVQQLPQVQVNLGPDQTSCQGNPVLLNAGNPGLSFYWSGGQTSQTINALAQGTYKVTVSDGVNCPGADDVFVKFLPNLNASISGPDQACAGDTVLLTLNIGSNAAFDLELTNNLAQAYPLPGAMNGSTFLVVATPNPFGTAYDLNFVAEQLNIDQSNACLHFPSPAHILQVNPSGGVQNDTMVLCQGDSVNIDGIWRSQPGIFSYQVPTANGCFNTVNTALFVNSPGTQVVQLQGTTCNALAAGVFTQNLTSQNGCDSTVITTVSLLPSDTTFVSLQGCDPAEVGTSVQTFVNQAGCDSLVITTTSLLPSAILALNHSAGVCLGDSTGIEFLILGPGSFDINLVDLSTGQAELLSGVTSGYVHYVSPTQSTVYWPTQVLGNNPTGCLEINNLVAINVIPTSHTSVSSVLCEGDSLFLQGAWQTDSGTYIDTLTNGFGCDSIVETNLLVTLGSTVFWASQTCDPSLVGTTTVVLQNQNGCDSAVVTTVSLLPSDTVFLASQTCDPSLVGTNTVVLQNQNGCDSTVVINISLVPSDTVFLASQTCDPNQTGTFTQHFTNTAGCDSMVVTTVTLVPSDMVMLTATTCDSSAAGTSMAFYTNQFGCDSVVVTNTQYVATDTVFLATQTCEESEAGIFTQDLTNQFGCDSTVVTLVAWMEKDTNFVFGTTCDPAEVGSYTTVLTNQHGCDSVVVNEVSLLPSDTTLITHFTCEAVEIGTETTLLQSTNGCDSIVISVTSLLPTDSCQIIVPPVATAAIYVPNAFSPNEDGINDLLQIFADPDRVKTVKSFQVYDRWGDVVYRNFDFQPNDPSVGWDGKRRGQPLGTAVFAWFAEIEFVDGEVKVFKGDVMLVR